MYKVSRHQTGWLRPIVGARFQVLFHSPVRGAFHLSLTVLVHYWSLRSIQPYRMVPAASHRISRVPRYSGYCPNYHTCVYGIITLYDITFQLFPLRINNQSWQSYNPNIAETTLVWAYPRSLATTQGITFVFFSSAYLDVSVQRVCLRCRILGLQPSGLPHSDIYGSKVICTSPQLFAAYHVFLRL